MRALVLVALAACSADIPSGSYQCGPEQACPPDQACNGADNTCVAVSQAQPFMCLAKEEHEPDNAPAMATAMPHFDCVSNVFTFDGCLAPGDTQDWFSFAAPAGCSALEADIEVSFPVAFEAVGVVLGDDAGSTVAPDGTCKAAGTAAGDDERCIQQTITPGQNYTVEIKPSGGGDCGGTCNYNRYTLQVQLTTPG